MKRQGKYGFTFDSKAEEWGYWAKGCLEHNPPADSIAFRRLADHAIDMKMLAAIEGCDRGIKICDSLDAFEAKIYLGMRPAKIDMAGYLNAVPARTPQPYAELDAVCTQIARPVPVWPFAAFAAVAATLAMVIASVEGWI
jgi:hypothetical protein